jgi:SNF2 family DNA or RNA helicase
MLRRKKDSELDGKPIIRLPPKTQEDVQVQLDTDERDFYNQLEHKSQVIFNKYVRDGTVGKNYSNILVLLLKLRQACCHPHLDLDFEEAAAPIDEWDEGILSLVKNLEPSVVDRIKEMDGAFECPICTDAVPSPSFFIPCGHDTCSECLTRLVDSESTSLIQQGNEGGSPGNVRCPVCRSNFDPRKCFTFELFRKIHMPETVNKEEAVQADDDDDSDTDSESGSELDSGSDTGSEEVDHRGNLRDFIVDDDYFSSGAEDEEAESKNDVKREGSTPIQAPKVEKKKKRKSKKSKKKHKGEGKDKAHDVKPGMLKSLRKEARKNRAAHKKYMAYLRKTWLPSTKVTECMKLLNRIQETTGEKTIIFSQWTMLLDLLEVAMRNEGFARKHERYDGSMSAVQRNDAASAFRSNPDVKVILVSLRAGNAGLNLTAASHVIIMDPFWNPYVEMQAVDRAYRIGQQREVKVYRILTQETVEDRIIQLQEDKKEIIEAALDESESRKIGRLGIAELKYLFTGRR